MAAAKVKDAVSKISSGQDLREEMALTVGPNANWEDFLVVAPMCVSLLGELIVISTTADFSLEKKPPKDGFQLLKYPNSFRASLTQVANAGWEAFNEAHTNMDRIRLLTANVPGNLKDAVNILLKGTNEELEEMLPIPMNEIQFTADQCLTLAQCVEAKYISVMELTAELLEACVSARGEYEHDLKETEIALQVAREKKITAEEQKEMTKKAYDKLEKAVNKAEDSYYQAMDSMPKGLDIFGLNLVESWTNTYQSVVEGVANLFTFGGVASSKKAKQESQGNDGQPSATKQYGTVLDDQTLEVYSQAIQIQLYTDMLEAVCVEKGTLKESLHEAGESAMYVGNQLEYIKRSVQSLPVAKAIVKDRAIQICTTGMSICVEILELSKQMQVTKKEKKSLTGKILNLQDVVKTFVTEGKSVIGSSPTNTIPPNQRKMSTESNGASTSAQLAVQNARFKIEQSSANLEFTRDKYEKACDKKMEASKKLGEILQEMQKLDIRKLDFENIKNTLIKGIRALGKLREQWAKLVMFFSMMSNMIECSLNTSVKGFLQHASVTQKSQLKGYPISSLKRDMIYEQAFQSAKIAYLVNMISGTYVEVSKLYIMDRIAGLGQLLGYNPETQAFEIQRERQKLLKGMEDAQKEISFLVKERKSEFDMKIATRIKKIRGQLEQALPEDPSSEETKQRMQIIARKAIENVNESKSDIQTSELDADEFV